MFHEFRRIKRASHKLQNKTDGREIKSDES